MVEKRDHTHRSRQACRTKHWHCVETFFKHLLPRAFERDPCPRVSASVSAHGDDVDPEEGIQTVRVNNREGNAVSQQRTAPEKQTGTLDIVIIGLSVVVIASATTLARAETGDLLVKSSQEEKCTGREVRDSPGSHLLVLLRLGR